MIGSDKGPLLRALIVDQYDIKVRILSLNYIMKFKLYLQNLAINDRGRHFCVHVYIYNARIRVRLIKKYIVLPPSNLYSVHIEDILIKALITRCNHNTK